MEAEEFVSSLKDEGSFVVAYKRTVHEYRYPDDDPEWADDRLMDDVYVVLTNTDIRKDAKWDKEQQQRVATGELYDATYYTINAEEPYSAFTVRKSQLNHYIEIFTQLKAQADATFAEVTEDK